MPQIMVLDQSTIDKIAAGEVIERPASVVKELLENAIDAQATAVTVEIRDGGISLIRVTDNGCGIPKEEVPLAFLRHSTSKIKSAEDLFVVSSLGFRGEALSSIAAVAQVELITKTAEQLSGVRYLIEGGKERSLEEIGAPDGTTFIVRNLFYNTPARQKFLKTAQTEGAHVAALVEKIAMSHPDISVRLIQNNQNRLHTSGNHSLKDIIYTVFGREIAANLLAVEYEREILQIHGFGGKPVIARSNRNFENYYINGRYVKSAVVARAIEEAYRPFMMQHKYPFVLLHIRIEPEYLDVNVHPTKMELRFRDEERIYQMIFEALRDALAHKELIPQAEIGRKSEREKTEKLLQPRPEPFENRRREQLGGTGNRTGAGRTQAGGTPDPDKRALAGIVAGSGETAARFGEATANKAVSGSGEAALAETAGPDKMALAGIITGSGETAAWFGEAAENRAVSDSDETALAGNAADRNYAAAPGNPEPFDNDPKAAEAAEKTSSTESTETRCEYAPHQSVYQQVAERQTEYGETGQDAEKETAPQTSAPRQLDFFEEKLLTPQSRLRHKLIGQLFDTYWLVEFGDHLYIIDQHAAHEKVLYERTIRTLKSREYTSQMVDPPIILTLGSEEQVVLKKYQNCFTEIGFEIEPFGGKEYAVRAVPDNLFSIAKKELLMEMLDDLSDDILKGGTESVYDRVATMSCKAAVKGNHALSPMEADHLIDELLTLDNPYACPHGRPTIISMSKYELEKKFKRIV